MQEELLEGWARGRVLDVIEVLYEAASARLKLKIYSIEIYAF